MSPIQSHLRDCFAAAMVQAFGPDFASADPQIRPSTNPQFGDFQANAAMGLAGRLGKPPRVIAQELINHLDLSAIAQAPEIAGPGFINLRLKDEYLAAQTAQLIDRGLNPATATGVTAVVDYSGPNVAKEMHVGHLRSTIIGDAIARVLAFAGDTVIRQNHLGDWGTQFGMLIEHITDLGWTSAGDYAISDLNDLYKAAKVKFDTDAAFVERARKRVVALQSGDPATLELWRLLIATSKHHFAAVYQLLDVLLTEDDYRGESFYNPLLPKIVADLQASGHAVPSDGAICAFPEGFKGQDGEPSPLILQKSDGGYGYDTTDMAALRYRLTELAANRLLYVTDARQKQHFAMVFKTAVEAGWLTDQISAEHVAFGSVLGDDGKPFKSRSGETVKLADLLAEAESRALAIVTAKNPDLPIADQKLVAHVVGIGAIKYADLSSDRVKDYVFSWERMLSFDGNTAPYLQNAYVRIRSIFRKAGLTGKPAATTIVFSEPAERDLALRLFQFDETVVSVAKSLEPHRLCNYLYELAAGFHQFFEQCPVIKAPSDVLRQSRLALCYHVGLTLKTGLGLLGIGTLDRM